MFPTAFYAQTVSSALVLALGAAAHAVARADGLPPRHRVGWALFAAVALATGISKAAQDVFGGAALLAGAGTPTWDAYLDWAPGMNYGRGMFWYALGALLVVHGRPWGHEARVLRRGGVWLVLGVAYALGQAAGFVEGTYSSAHEAHYAIFNHGLILLLAAGLVVAVTGGAADRLLALVLALNVAVLPLFSTWLWWRAHRVGGASYPSSLSLTLYYQVFWLGSLAITLRRLWLARRGVPVPGLLASLPAVRPHGVPEQHSPHR